MGHVGVTFAAGVCPSTFGRSREPINAHYAKTMFTRIQEHRHRDTFRVRLGGSGGWPVTHTNGYETLEVDCVIDGRSESAETITLFHDGINGNARPQHVEVAHPTARDTLIFPDKPTTVGVVEMTTGCGANVKNGDTQISLATEDMFIWGQVQTETPFFFPNREARGGLYTEVVETPGVEPRGRRSSRSSAWKPARRVWRRTGTTGSRC